MPIGVRAPARPTHRGCCSASLDPPLDLADGVEVLGEPRAIGRPDASLEARHVLADRIEDAAPPPHLREPLRAVPPSPNSRSNTTRGLFSVGSGVVGVRQESVFMYAQL